MNHLEHLIGQSCIVFGTDRKGNVAFNGKLLKGNEEYYTVHDAHGKVHFNQKSVYTIGYNEAVDMVLIELKKAS